ncbi:VirK/YbjX family protein [Massilia solisilvae]|uniref:VirK/YbjX family protein n=1 Tax=Massilia solisilvae TaxID=1811225 RepID=A0ABT2BE20_9BURK|nr:VirK/YbjX family protein [Massilia solisilvae]MCS0606774.1 VirK/YbjX family protein [Massilia solisilvae]
MKLYSAEAGLAERLISTAQPSITIRSGVSPELKTVPYWRELLKLKVRSLAHYQHTRRWLGLLNSHPAFSEYVRNWPRFLYKIYRPYLTATLSMDARLAVLSSHYQFMFEHGLGPLLVQASHSGVPLVAFEGKGGTAYRLVLRAVGTNLEREGELVLQLCQGDELVYSAAFTFAWRGESHAVNIGCVQGGRSAGNQDAIRLATRELHGMRPRQLLVTLVRQLGHQFGCAQLMLVSNENRVVRCAMRKGRVLADYNQAWEEMGAERMADGDYRIACAPLQAPDLEAIPSKKRSEARKRHELMTFLATTLNERLWGQRR